MKKKGFVLVESIVVLVIVVLALTLFLSSYFLLTRKSESKEYYDLPNDKYLLYNVSNIWSLGNNGENAYTQSGSFVIDKNTCGNYVSKYSDNECQKVFSDTDLERYAVIYNINSSFDTGRIKDINGMTSDIIEYLKTLKKLDGATDLSYVVGVFKRNVDGKDKKYYAALTFNPYPTPDDSEDPSTTIVHDGEYLLTGVGSDLMVGKELKTYKNATYSENILTVNTALGGLLLPTDIFQQGNSYILTYKIKKISGTLHSINGTVNRIKNVSFYIDGVPASTDYKVTKTVTNITDDTEEHIVKVLFTTQSGGTIRIYIQPNFNRSDEVTLSVTDVHVHQVYSGPKVLSYNDAYSSSELPYITNDLSNVSNMSKKIHLGWYADESFTKEIFVGNTFNSSNATFINDSEAYVYANIKLKSDAETYCVLNTGSNSIGFKELKAESWQISTSSSTPTSYDNKKTLTILTPGEYFGHTKSGSHTSKCYIIISEKEVTRKYCKSEALELSDYWFNNYSMYNCTNGNFVPLGDYSHSNTCWGKCSDTCDSSSEGKCRKGDCVQINELYCKDESFQEVKAPTNTCTKTININATSCPSGWNGPYERKECPKGYKIIKNSELCSSY